MELTNWYRIRSRVVKGAPARTFYVQRKTDADDGSEHWHTVAQSRSERQARAYLAQALGNPRTGRR